MLLAILNNARRFMPVAALLLAFAAGWLVNGWRWEAKGTAALQAQIEARTAAERDAAVKSEQLEANLAAIRATTRQLNQRLSHEINRPEYACPVPPSGMQLRAAALAGLAPGESGPALRPNP